MRVVRVLRSVEEAPSVRTIYFRDELCALATPGQFIMVYVPGLEEVPMSLSTIGPDGLVSITVKVVGPTTRALSELRPGSKLGIRGPFGTGFRLEGRKPLLVGAGTGAAPIMPLAELMASAGLRPTLVLAAKTEREIIFLERAERALGPDGVKVATEDGSLGFKGLATGVVAELLAKGHYDPIYACGREPLLVKLLDMALKHGFKHVQLSLERFVKCGMGLCGHCALGPYRVCTDGPVFDLAMLTHPAVRAELGRWWRDECGRPIGIPEAKR